MHDGSWKETGRLKTTSLHTTHTHVQAFWTRRKHMTSYCGWCNKLGIGPTHTLNPILTIFGMRGDPPDLSFGLVIPQISELRGLKNRRFPLTTHITYITACSYCSSCVRLLCIKIISLPFPYAHMVIYVCMSVCLCVCMSVCLCLCG